MGISFTGYSIENISLLFGISSFILLLIFLKSSKINRIVVPYLNIVRRAVEKKHLRMMKGWRFRIFGLVLSLLIIGLLSFASGLPVLETKKGQINIILLDASPSMGAITQSKSTRFDLGKRIMIETFKRLSKNNKTIIGLAGEGIIPIPFDQENEDGVMLALRNVSVGLAPLNIEKVIRDSRSLIGDMGRIILITDLSFDVEGDMKGIEVIPVPNDGSNVAIMGMAARVVQGKRNLANAMVTVKSYGGEASGIIILESSKDGLDGFVLGDAKEFKLSDMSEKIIEFNEIPLYGPHLRARIDVKCETCNALPTDDQLMVYLERSKVLKVGIVGQSDIFLDTALMIQQGIEIVRLSEMPSNTPQGIDLLIVYGSYGKIPEGIPCLVIYPRHGNGRINVDGIVGPLVFDTTQGSDILSLGVLVGNIVVQKAVQVRPGQDHHVVLAAKNGFPLVVRGENTVTISFLPTESNIVLSYAWPVLVSNIISFLVSDMSGFAKAETPIAEGDLSISQRAESFSQESSFHEDFIMFSAIGKIALILGIILILFEWAWANKMPDASV